MSEELTRKMAKAYYAKSEDCSYDATAMRAVLRTVLEHYSEPGNVSDEMCRLAYAHAIAAAMRAELKRIK